MKGLSVFPSITGLKSPGASIVSVDQEKLTNSDFQFEVLRELDHES